MLAQRVELSQLTRKCFIRGRGFEDHEYRIAVYTYKRLNELDDSYKEILPI
jgi:hypothetical protein